jgi:hypothetical protein
MEAQKTLNSQSNPEQKKKKKNNAGGVTILDCKLCYRVKAMKQRTKTDIKTNGTE